MECYISQDYFPKLEELLITAKDDILTGKATNINAVFQLLSALTINTDIDSQELKNYTTPLIGNKFFSSFKDRIIFNAIKNQKLKTCNAKNLELDFKNLSAYYFLNNNEASNNSETKGIICKGPDYDGESFYDNCTVADLPISNSWSPIVESLPPVNAMMIIDQYIFAGDFKKKLSNLTDFIKLYKGNMAIPFHLTILFSTDKKKETLCTPNQIQIAFDELMAITNLEVQLLVDNKITHHDRLFFTNYTSGNIGIPFDGRPTRFTQNFLGRENDAVKIQRNYKNYRVDLKSWHSFISKIPPKIGVFKTRWESSQFTNRLFLPFLEN